MKIYQNHATAPLLERMESLEQEDHHGWRCVYVQLHNRQERLNTMLRVNFINRAIIDLLDKDEGHIYFCDDGDIFILFEGALKPVVARLGSHFGDLDADQLRGQGSDSMFSFFDLSKHWEGFMELCREKAVHTLHLRDRLPHIAMTEPAHHARAVNA